MRNLKSFICCHFTQKVLIYFFFCIITAKVTGQVWNDKDSVKTKKRNLIAVPYTSYSEETSWRFGAAAQYFFWNKSRLDRVSFVNTGLYYTLKNQLVFSFVGQYFISKNLFLYFNTSAQKYPDRFYGIGNNTSLADLEKYTPFYSQFRIQPMYYLNERVKVGLNLKFRGEKILSYNSGGLLASGNYIGVKPYFTAGIGPVFNYDTRNNFFFPTKGYFLKLALNYNPDWSKNNFSYLEYEADFRTYLSIYESHVIAFQSLTREVIGDNIPFQLLHTLGGDEEVRGYYRNLYRDKFAWINQLEYRFPIYGWIRGTVFFASGDVASGLINYSFNNQKFAYGLGLRLKANEAGVNLRVDLARNRFGGFAWTFTATEAF